MVYAQLGRLTFLYMHFWYTVTIEAFWLGKWLLTLVAFAYTISWLVEKWHILEDSSTSHDSLSEEDRIFRTSKTRDSRLAKIFLTYQASPLQIRPISTTIVDEQEPKKFNMQHCNSFCLGRVNCFNVERRKSVEMENRTGRPFVHLPKTEIEEWCLKDPGLDLLLKPKCPLPCDDLNLTDEQKSEMLSQLSGMKSEKNTTDCEPEKRNIPINNVEIPPHNSRKHTSKKHKDFNMRIVALFE